MAQLLHIGFNRTDARIVTISCANHLVVVDTASNRGKKKYSFNDQNGAILISEMLFRTNMICIVRGLLSKTISIWDSKQEKFLQENTVECSAPILSLKIHSSHLIVVHEDRLVIHDIQNSKLHTRPTVQNPLGLCAMTSQRECAIIAYPGNEIGNVKVEDLITGRATNLNAHNGEISCIALSQDGSLLATASQKGTLIRIFETATGTKIRTLRRGTTNAFITSIAFSHDCKHVACTSDKGTLHVWSIVNTHTNRTSSLSFVKFVVDVSYVNSEWSMSSYSGIEGRSECAFPPDDSSVVYVLTSLGRFLELKIDQGTEARLQDTRDLVEELGVVR
jgi:WD40 repeat protein